MTTRALIPPRLRRAAIGAVGVASLFTVAAMPAAAAGTLSGGTGAETMLGYAYGVPPFGTPCAHYTAYNANVTFTVAGGTVDATVNSGTAKWDEDGGGTYPYNSALPPPLGPDVGCSASGSAAGAAIPGFTYTLVGGSATAVCTAVPATYARNGLSITVTAASSTGCPYQTLTYSIATLNVPGDPFGPSGAVTGLVGTLSGLPVVGPIVGGVLGGLVGGPLAAYASPTAACNAPIAPSACLIGSRLN